jgi:hypothetical protein
MAAGLRRKQHNFASQPTASAAVERRQINIGHISNGNKKDDNNFSRTFSEGTG